MIQETLELESLVDALQDAVPSVPADASGLSPQQIKLLYSVLSTIPDGVAVVDKDGSLLLSNPALLTMIEIDEKEPAPEQWPETFGLFLPNTTTSIPSQQFPLHRALAGGESGGIEVYIRNSRVPGGLWVNAIARSLKDEEGTLWGAVMIFRDATEHRRLEQEILDISGREQRRIGQDLHDGLCQILTGIKFMCSASLRKIPDKSSAEACNWIEVQKLVGQALREADNVAKGLYPVELEVKGLVEALRDLATKTRKLYCISCTFVCDTPVAIEDPEVAIHVYRIAQEAIANSIKHGRAKNIVIGLSPTEERFSLLVKNDGLVPIHAPQRQGMGWRIMNYRADMIGATLRSEQEAGGFVLACDFPRTQPRLHA